MTTPTVTPIQVHLPTKVDTPQQTNGTTLERSTQEPQPRKTTPRKTTTTSRVNRWRNKPWPLLIIGIAAAVAVWSGWVGLGQMAGFGIIRPLPGVWDDLHINTTFVLPLSVEAYAAYALRVWIGTSSDNKKTHKFAKWSAIISMIIGAVAQVAYHLMEAAGYTKAPWPVVMLVATVPVIVLGLASGLAKLVTNDTKKEN